MMHEFKHAHIVLFKGTVDESSVDIDKEHLAKMYKGMRMNKGSYNKYTCNSWMGKYIC